MQHLLYELLAPVISAYREQLTSILDGAGAKTRPHDEIIAQLDADAETFTVLLFKTDMVLPYTSVFIRLDCGYWTAEKEAALRQEMEQATVD